MASISNTATGDYIWKCMLYLMKRYGIDQADRDLAPLNWYTATGRASVEFLRKLFSKPPYMVARLLHMGGSYDEAIERIRKYIA